MVTNQDVFVNDPSNKKNTPRFANPASRKRRGNSGGLFFDYLLTKGSIAMILARLIATTNLR